MKNYKDRPYVFCHMMTSIDGKICGKYMNTPESQGAGELFYNLAFGDKAHYQHQGWLSGRVTSDDNFTFYKKPLLDKNAATVPSGDFVLLSDLSKYYISIDPKGILGWQADTIHYQDTHAKVLEILTNQASNAYKAYLRSLNIPYMIAGDKRIDWKIVLKNLKHDYGMATIMLGGGGVLNWSLIQEGLYDELSVVIAPVADASEDAPSLFETKRGLTLDQPRAFIVKQVKSFDNNVVWLNYDIKQGEVDD